MMLFNYQLLLVIAQLLHICQSTSNCSCSNLRSFISLNVGQNLIFRGYQSIYPTLNFTCNDSLITKFIFKGQLNSDMTSSTVKIQIWKRTSEQRYAIIKSWNLGSADVVERADGLLQTNEAFQTHLSNTGAIVNSSNILGLFSPSAVNQVEIYFDRSSTSASEFYYLRESSTPSVTLNIGQMTTGDETYPKITAEFSCYSTSHISITSTILLSSVTPPTLVSTTESSAVTSIRTIATSTTTQSMLSSFITMPALMSSAKSDITVGSSIFTSPDLVTESVGVVDTLTILTSVSSNKQQLVTTVSSTSTVKLQTTAVTIASPKDFISSMTTSAHANRQETSYRTVTSSTLSTPNLDNNNSSRPPTYLIASVAIATVIMTISLIFAVFSIYMFYSSIRRRKTSHPIEATEPQFVNGRPQSTTESLYTNHAYVMNRMNKQTSQHDCAADQHHYDIPSFSKGSEPQVIKNRYSVLNRLSHFNRNPAYSTSQGATEGHFDVDYEEVN